MLVAAACGSSTAHPGSLVDSDDGSTLPDTFHPVDAGIPDGSPTTVQISGGDGGSISDIRFGDDGFVNCGAAATSVPVQIANTGPAPLTWTATLSAGNKAYTLSPLTGNVAPGASATLQIIPNAVPAVSDVTTDLYGGVVTIQTSASNDTTHVIQLHQTARGVILKSTLAATFDFHSQAVSQTASSQYSLTNSGNVSAAVRLSVGSARFGVLPPSVTPTMPFLIGPSGTGAPTITFNPIAVQTYTDTLVTELVSEDGGAPAALCGPLPGNITLQGQGNNTVALSPTNLDFGSTNCGATAAPQTITLQNSGAPITFTMALAKGGNSPFTVAADKTSVGSAGTATITVTPVAIPKPSKTDPNGFGDTLTITTNDGAPTQHTITLNQTARGAILQFAPVSIATVGHAATQPSQFANFQVLNTGNYQGTYQLGGGSASTAVTQTAGPGGTWSSSLFAGNLVGGGSAPGVLTVFNPAPTVQYLGHVALTIQPNANGQPTILCADAPPDMQLSALGN
jgi:hypothetical protein